MKKLILFVLLLSLQIFSQTFDFKVNEINEVQLKKIIKERNNKFLLINVWATWCIPCREEFPDLVKLQSKYENQFDFLGLSADYKEDVNDKILPFIKQNKVNFPNYISGFMKDEDLINFLNKNWSGALPATFIYDKSGKQIKVFDGKQSYDTFEKAINSILNK